MDQKTFDSLSLCGSIFGGIRFNEDWQVKLIKKEWFSISNTFTIQFESDGVKTAYEISFKLKIMAENRYSYSTIGGGSLSPGYKKTISCAIKENARTVVIDKVNYN